MDRERLIEEIKRQEPSFLQAANKKGYICPVCGNGTGNDGDGIIKDKTDKTGTHYKCFKCGLYADILELYGKANSTEDFNEQGTGAGAYYGLNTGGQGNEYQKQPETEQYTQKQEQEQDYTSFFKEAHQRIKKTDYPQRRGLSEAVINRFMLGFVESWTHPKALNAPASPRLIIPTSKHSYLARDTREELTAEQKKYSKSKVGSVRIFNSKVLQTAKKPIFIVEGEIDALSIIEVGGEAVATGSTANRRALLKLLENQRPAHPLIIAMDNDKAGYEAAEELTMGLQGLKIPFYRINPYGEHKDANETLQADRDALRTAVFGAKHIEDEAREAEQDAYLKTSTVNYLQNFIDGIADSVNTPYIPTGFNKLDEILDGGLYEGLYIIGAISSLGKTTLITQIADQIAQSGIDVLIISLEMARTEIIAKSISRHTLQSILASGGDIRNAKTTRGITTGKRYQSYSQTERELINNAIKSYSEYAAHIYITEGMEDMGTEQVRKSVKKHLAITGKSPVVIIDYLQILAPYNERATDKQATDKAVMELKRISRDYKTPVIGISSFNRANYKEAVTMEAFKESGAVEYSSDILIGLQLKGAGGKEFNAIEEKKKDPRQIELVILKNRNGRAGDKLSFNYYPLFNYFTEQ